MMRFDTLQANKIKNNILIDDSFYMSPKQTNDNFLTLQNEFKKIFGFNNFRTFSFTKEGFTSLMMGLDGTIGVSVGECEAIVLGAIMAKSYGKNIIFIPLAKDGSLDMSSINEMTFVFVSSYAMDTFFINDLEVIKNKTNGKIISNFSAHHTNYSDIGLLDGYKLSGFGACGVMLHNDSASQYLGEIDFVGAKLCYLGYTNKTYPKLDMKNKFLETFQSVFGENLILFVEPKSTLSYSLHLGFKNIKARELIKTLALENIFITNGEGCSLGLSKPSRVLQEMGYDEACCRWAISFDFEVDLKEDEIVKIVKLIYKYYRQIKALQ